IAARELEGFSGDSHREAAETARAMADVAAAAVANQSLPPGTSLRDALRRGALDGDREFYELLVRLTGDRRSLVS
ncbi:MAG TPA: hypothetical protein VIR45_03830, partial [Kiloniellaceae bacterium]